MARAVGEAGLGGQPGLVGGSRDHLRVALVADDGLRARVLDDVGDLRGREPVVDRHVVPTGLQCREVHLDRLHPVRQHRGDGVTVLQAEPAEGVDVAVGPGQEVPGAVLRAVRIDDRDEVGILLGVLVEAGHLRRPPGFRF
jgi:hypothetical protein